MALNLLTVTGKVVSVEYKLKDTNPKLTSNVLQIVISVATGEKKKDGEQYPPSYLVQGSVWGNFADYLKDVVGAGSYVAMSGKLTEPNIYEKDGEYKFSQKLWYVDSVEVFQRDTAPKPEVEASETKSNKTKKTAKPVFDDDDDDDDDINFDD